MLPVETLKHIVELTKEANPGRRIVQTGMEPKGWYYVEEPDGSMRLVRATPRPDAHQAIDLDTLVRFTIARAPADTAATPQAILPHIWYSRAGIVAIADPELGEHSDRCILNLSPSPQLTKLIDWEKAGKGTPTQTELVILLRTLFAECAPLDLLPAVRGVRTNKKQEIDSQIQQGKVSLGKALVAEMTGVNAIPERVGFRVPVFAQEAVRIDANVRVEIDPDPQQERFNLYVIPGDIEAAFSHAEDQIASRLRRALGDDSDIPIYRGVP